MPDHIDWQRTTAISRMSQRLAQDPNIPIARLYLEVAGYVGASAAQVETWWKGRNRQ